MKKLGILLMMSLILVLTACGNKYEKDINQALDKVDNHTKGMVDETFVRLDKKHTNNYVYEDGKVIVVEYAATKDDVILTKKLIKNASTDEFEFDDDDEKKYMKEHEPVYKEMNLKKK